MLGPIGESQSLLSIHTLDDSATVNAEHSHGVDRLPHLRDVCLQLVRKRPMRSQAHTKSLDAVDKGTGPSFS